ncbi:MAG: aminotransferase class I/II-fold pyridoxal phosphate-dependent enzyme [Thermoproteus sp. AZ2]|uniref:Aminotransferase class I/II-fold pyridoxal phosphate-dependent enzyme n=1 Tax=Thermoproteus sp. AZ2 TaxID=1609232 RepID=A0ACC6V3P6_9CREN|nr:MAG: aminotransferase class I/II [Thermoproteus sp. AZ2]
MKIEHFEWLRSHRAEYDLSSSGMAPLSLDEVLRLGEPGNLVEDLASLYGVDRRNIALTHGAQEGNFAALSALRGAVEEAVTVVPEYEPIRALPGFLGLKHVEAELGGSPSALFDLIRPGVVLFFSNPNNPTGLYLGRKELWELSDSLRRAGAYAVVDSIFLDFVLDDVRGLPLERMAYTFSTSKFYTMAGAKAGWVIGDEDIVRRIGGVIDLVSPLVHDACLSYASILVRKRDWVRERNLGIIRPNIEALRGAGVEAQYVEHMPIAYVKCRGSSGSAAAEELLRRGVLVVPGRLFGRDDGFRIGLGSSRRADFEAAAGIIADVLKGLCRG